MADITVAPSGEDYTTLDEALDNVTVDPTTVTISGDWTSATDTVNCTVADDNVTITTTGTARHAGFDNAGTNYELDCSTNGDHCIQVDNTGCIIDGLIIQQGATGGSEECVRLTAAGGTITVKNSILWADSQESQQDGIYFGNIDCTINVEQCYLIGFSRVGIHSQNYSGNADHTVNVNSCGVWNCGYEDGGGIATESSGGTKIFNIHNTWSIGNDNDPGTDAEDYHQISGSGTWNVSHSIDGDNSLATVDSGGTDNLASAAINESTGGGDEIIVVDITSAPFDLTLVIDETNNDAQTRHRTLTIENLTIPTVDIAGTTRVSGGSPAQGDDYDVGPFEIVVAAAGGQPTMKRWGGIPGMGQGTGLPGWH